MLAPMRLLTPILEEPSDYGDITKHTESTLYSRASNIPPHHNHHHQQQQLQQPQLARSILSVISEILNNSGNTSASAASNTSMSPKKSFDWTANSNASQLNLTSNRRSFAGSSLVHTIDEVKNRSMCNLFFASDCSDDTSSSSSNNAAAPQVPPRNNQPAKSVLINSPGDFNQVEPLSASQDQSYYFAREGSLKSVKSNTLVVHQNDQDDDGEIKPELPARRNSLLSTSEARSRKNFMELTAGNSSDILNTPKRPSKLPLASASHSQSISSNISSSVQGNSSDGHNVTNGQHQSNNGQNVISKNSHSYASNVSNSHHQHQNSSSHHANSASEPMTVTPKRPSSRPLQNSNNNATNQLTMSLSPSSKYETPTPPLFVRSSNVRLATRRRFSIIRKQFELDQDPMTASNGDLYQNVSDGDLLNNDLSNISSKSLSTPSFLDSRKFEKPLRADEKYNMQRLGWATSSTRQKRDPHDDDQENVPPIRGPKPLPKPAFLEDSLVARRISPHLGGATHRRLTGSLSPKSRIFGSNLRQQRVPKQF